MRALEQIVVASIRQYCLFNTNDSVGVAVSGGRDSITMLYALEATQRLHGGKLSVLSVDHGLREESKLDVSFVNNIASRLGLPFTSISLQLTNGQNLQSGPGSHDSLL